MATYTVELVKPAERVYLEIQSAGSAQAATLRIADDYLKGLESEPFDSGVALPAPFEEILWGIRDPLRFYYTIFNDPLIVRVLEILRMRDGEQRRQFNQLMAPGQSPKYAAWLRAPH